MSETPKPIPISKLTESKFSDDMWIIVSRQEAGKWKSYRIPLDQVKCKCETPEPKILPDSYEDLPKNERTVFHSVYVMAYGNDQERLHCYNPLDHDLWDDSLNDDEGNPNGNYKGTGNGVCQGTHKVVDVDEISMFAQPLHYTMGRNGSQWSDYHVLYQNDINELFQGHEVPRNKFYEIYGSYVPWGDNTTIGMLYNSKLKLYKDRTKAEDITSGWGVLTSAELLQMLGELPRRNENRLDDIYDFFFINKENDVCTNGEIWDLTRRKNISGLSFVPAGKLQNSDFINQRPPRYDSFGTTQVLETKRDKNSNQVYLTSIVGNKDTSPTPMHSAGVRISSTVAFAHGGHVRYTRVKTPEELGYKLVIDEANDKVLFVSPDDERENLPIGMERGIALRYANRSERVVTRSWSEIQTEAAELMTSGIINVDQ